MNSIYQEILLEHYKHPKNAGRLQYPTKTVTVFNTLCGDKITMDVLVNGNTVVDISFAGEGCVISMSMASQLTEYAKKKTKNELRKLDRTFMIKMLGMELGPNRLKCALLPLEALQKAVE